MIQDPGPKTNLGFGIPIVHGERDSEAPETGIATNAGVIGRALNDKPLAKFAAVAVASLVSMHVAGKVARAGGYRFADFAQTYASQSKTYSKQVDKGLSVVRNIQDTLDEYEGVFRKRVDPTAEGRNIFVRRENGQWVSDEVTRIDSAKLRFDNPNLPDWQRRDEIQQRLVRQARRLPYELPGFYAADKLIIDPMLGSGEERKVNWKNPVDVVGDFAWESVKNVAFNVVPFEAATGSGAHTLRRMRKAMGSPAGPDGTSTGVLTTQVLLEQLGVKLQDITEKTIRSSKQSTGAFSAAIEAASQERRNMADLARAFRGNISAGPAAARNSQYARRDHAQFNATAILKSHRDQALNSMPGPFSGMATGFKQFKNSYREIGQAYDDWQDIVSGRSTLANLAKKYGPDRVNRVRSYMNDGGGGQIEAMALQIQKLGIKAPRNSDDVASASWGGSLATAVKQDHYKDGLIRNLTKVAGLSQEDAIKFVTHASRISAPANKGKNASHDMVERIRFGKKAHQSSSTQDWFNNLTAEAQKFELHSFGQVDRKNFERAISLTDQSFWSGHQQEIIKQTVQNYHKQITEVIAPQTIGQNIASRRVDYASLKQNLDYNDNFLVRNTARAMGIKTYDGNGSPYDLGALKNAIIDRGINANDKNRMLGYLMDKKVVKAPWEKEGGIKRLFGLQSVSANDALKTGYFSGYDDEVQNQITNLLHRAGSSIVSPINQNNKNIAETGLSALNMPGVYRGANGNIIDVGRIKRSIIGGIDALASETKIPILNFNPAQLAFYNSWMSVRRAAPIQFASKYSQQLPQKKMLREAGSDFVNNNVNGIYIFAKTGHGSTGKLFTSRVGRYGDAVDLRQAPGEYKPFLTNRLSMTGRMAELFLDSPAIESSQNKGGWRKLFDISSDQESNMFFGRESLIGRVTSALRGKDSSRANSRRSARLFASPGFKPKNLDGYSSEAFDGIVKDLKGYGLQGRVMKHLREKNIVRGRAEYDQILGYGSTAAPLQNSLVPDAARKILDEDINFTGYSPDQKIQLSSLQSSLRSLFRNADEQSGFWNLPAPAGIKTTGVSRRLDQLKSELSEYMVLREGVSTPPGEFAYSVAGIIKEIDQLHLSGAISSAEKAEARASALSLQLQFSKSVVALRNAKSINKDDLARLNVNKAVLEDTLGTSSVARELFSDYGQYKTEHQGLAGGVLRKIRSTFAPAPYNGPTEINSIGSAYTFIPTVASGFKDNPIKTAKGLFGGSWRDPEAVTTGTIYSTHLATRINKYFESVGLGLDLHRYKGPMDFYTRGLIGKRVLPAFAAGTTAVSIDRTIGGYVNEKDEQGNRVYSPLVLGGLARGVVEGQSMLAGVIPTGQTYSEKKEELLNGEVPIRQGRYWLLNSNTPFKGGRIEYFRPSWYRRLKTGGEYTPEMNQTPMERLAFGYDFSPLRPLDPYRFERQNYETRPYPVSGDYFTGPFGPVTSILNNTVGRILKPTIKMHETETAAALASYSPIGQAGAVSMGSVSQTLTGINASYAALAGSPGTSSTTPFYGANGYTYGPGSASAASVRTGNSVAGMYSAMSTGNGTYPGVYAPMLSQGLGGVGVDRFGSQVVPSTAVGRNSSVRNRLGRTAYETQEMAGIYGFASASVRSGLGIGGQDFTPSQAVLESASRGYSTSRAFWNLNLGGAGDVPLPIEGRFASLEFSEIIRRFVPKEQQGIQYINGINNRLGLEQPWLPGSGSMNNLRQGDPYNIPDATLRLPGTARDRVQPRFGSTPGGQYSPIDIHDMLGDLDPFGDNFRQIDQMVDSYATTAFDQAKIAQTRAQVQAVGIKNEFTPYKYKYMDPTDLVGEAASHPIRFSANKLFEDLAHRDTFINSKFLRTRTAVEDWERDNVYGATYPSWTSPYESFIEPVINRSTQRNPIAAISAAGAIGYMFGASPRARTMGSLIGGVIGGGASLFGMASEKVTGQRWMPRSRKKELMLEEQADILAYTHSMVNASRAMETGDTAAAQQFLQESTRTMYGANLNATPEQLALSVPKRKREHFQAMMYAPEQERQQILSTAGRLERRLLQASWGMNVEQLPDLQTYFNGRDLPQPDSSFWSPYTDMDTIKIKMGQNMGLDMAQMGYYPQQIQEANLINPEYPAIFSQTSSKNTRARLNMLLRDMGVRGSVEQRPVPFSTGDRYELSIGGR